MSKIKYLLASGTTHHFYPFQSTITTICKNINNENKTENVLEKGSNLKDVFNASHKTHRNDNNNNLVLLSQCDL